MALCAFSSADAQTGSFLPTWVQQSPATSPPARTWAEMAYDAGTSTIVLYSGATSSSNVSDTWTYNGVTWTQHFPGSSPGVRLGAAMAYDAASSQMILFSGADGINPLSADTWSWNGTNWTQLSPASSPPARTNAIMAYDAATSSLVLFGGLAQGGNALNDTWTWNGTTWTQQSSVGAPSVRNDSAMAYDTATGQVVLFGGQYGLTYYSDTWLWDGTGWLLKSPASSPPALETPLLSYDPNVSQAILFGYNAGTSNSDTWSWNGTSWTHDSNTTVPSERTSATMVFDPVENADVLFGGYAGSNTYLGDTWAFFTGPVNLGTAHLCPGTQTTPAPCSQSVTLTFAFTTGGKIQAPTVLTQGATGLDFTDAGTGTCTTNGTSYAYSAGNTCTVVVQFAPKYSGARLGGVTISNSSGTPLATLNISGTGTGPQVTYSPPVQSTLGSGFTTPDGIAVDASGDVFIAEYTTSTIKEMVAVSGIIPASPTINTLGSGFDAPSGVAVDGFGNLFIADQGHNEIKELPYAMGTYGTPVVLVSGLNAPSGVVVDGSGNLFFSDSLNNLVKEATAASGYTTINVIAAANGHFSDPFGLAMDSSGNLYVGDANNNSVKEVLATGGYVTVNTLGSGFSHPQSVAVDAAGDVFVGDFDNNVVKEMVAVGGSIPTSPTINYLGSGFSFPAGVAVGGNGNVYVTDYGHNRVEELAYATPPSLSFATTNEGTVSIDSPQTVTINNDGNASLIFAVPSSGKNPSISTNFTIGASSTCPQLTSTSSAASLAEGASCTDLISFAPTTTGSISGSLITTDNNLNGIAATQTVPLSGTGTYMVPTVTSISPAKGPIAGGNFVTITGTYFTGATAVNFGATPGTSITVVNSTTITVISPAATGASTVDVTVTTPYGTSPTSTADQFTYSASTPTITSISPNSGPATGGTTVTIVGGDEIDSAQNIYFGTVPVSGWSGSYTPPTATLGMASPAHAAGTVYVTIETPDGTTPISSATQFTYTPVSQTITFPALSNQLTTTPSVTVSATASSGLPVSYYVESATAEGWASGAAMPTALTNTTIAAPGDGMIYVAGGFGSSGRVATLEQYNPATQTWASMASMPSAVYQAAAATIGGLVYVAGGWNSSVPSTLLQAYNPSSNTWTTLASMSHDSACGIAGAINNLLYVTTACNGFSGYAQLLDVYNPTTNAWTSLTASPQAHAYGAGGVINGKLYVAGGYNSTGTATAELDVYTPGTNSWATLTAMPVALSGLSGDVIDGKLYVIGYATSASQTELYIYDPIANSWATQTLSPLSLGVTSSAAVAFGGDLFVAGGSTVSSGTPSSSFEILNTNACSNSGSTVTILGAGICTVTATQAGNTTYSGATPVSQSFTISVPAPTITAVSPNSGPIAGGTTVTLTGTNLTGATTVMVGSVAATSVTVVNATTLTATTPAEAAATVDITVTTAGGTSATGSADHFTFVAIPTLTSIAPNAGPFPGGTTITITGTNLNLATAVKFGTVAATSFTVVSATSITAVSPAESAGTVDVTVTTPGGTTATSTADHFTYGESFTALASSGSAGNYTLTATVSGIGSQTLAPTGNVSFIDTNNSNYLLGTGTLSSGTASLFANIGNTATGTSDASVATADFNGDGIPDLVVTGNPTTILLGNGDGTYRTGQSFNVGGGATYSFVAVGDFNNDGKPDLAMVDGEGYVSGTVAIYLGNGDGTFTAGTTPTTGPEPNSIAVADFNKDGNFDLAITNNYNSTMTILLGDGHGNFSTKSTPSTGTNTFPVFVAVGLFNADTYPDLVVANSNTSNITIFTGNGDGTFTTGSTYSTGSNITYPRSIAVGDFNGDSKPDLAVANFDGETISIFLGNGNGTFTAGTPLSTGYSPESVVTADFNGDGKLDLAVSVRDSYSVDVFVGNGSGGFTASPTAFIGSGVLGLLTADVNRDGRTDLVVADGSSNAVSTLLNEPTESVTASLASVSIVGNTPHNIEAVFPGDTNYSASTSGAVSLTAQEIQTTITLGTTAGATVPQGQPVTFTATVSPYGGNQNHTTNGDTVTFYSQSTGAIGTGTLSNGVATFTTSALPVGTNSLYAYYTGDPNYVAYSTSNTVTVIVVGSSTTTLAVTSGATPITTAASGTLVTLTASVNNSSTAVTTGQVNFCDATATYCTDVHLLGTANLTSAGTASIKLAPAIGSHQYKAVFIRTYDETASSSATSSLTITGLYPTTTSLAQSGSAGNYTLTATVVGVGTQTLIPTGAVSFNDTTNSNFTLAASTFGAPTAGLSFLNKSNPAAGNDSLCVATGDFNGDGIPDLAVGNYLGSNLTILLGNADGTFTAEGTSPPAYGSPTAIAVGDFNGDGKADIAVINSSGYMAILLGNGAGTFTAVTGLPLSGATPVAIAVADFNGDGILDVAVVNQGAATLSIYLGTGTGSFNLNSTHPSTGTTPQSLTVGDINGDGIPDIIVANLGSNTLTVLKGNGDGTFTAATPLTTGSQPFSVVMADFNADGKADLAVTNSGAGANNVSIFTGNGDGTFASPTTSPAGTSPQALAVADFNGDGIPDLAATNATSTSILLGNGHGGFTLTASPTIGSGQHSIAIADFNGDGVPDLAVADPATTSTVTILLTQQTQSVNATATSISPVGTGSHLIDAVYPGDSNFAASTSSTTSLTAQKVTTGLTLSANPTSSIANQSVTLTATLSPYAAQGHTTATETITFYSGAINLGTGTLSSSGIATLTLTTLPTGNDSLTAVYVTDANFLGVTSTALPFTVTALAPTVTGISPTSGPAAGGTTVTITGTNLTGANAVSFGTTAATTVTVVNATTVTATSPAGSGTVDVTVTTPGGTSTTSAADHFTYISAPTVTGISPTSGPTAGGTTVTITGTNLTGATAVMFGTTAATSFSAVNATTITATSPAGSGTVDVTVTTPGGTTATSAADKFTYLLPATHFTVTAPSTATAGTSFSLTVTALDSGNNVVPTYAGTVKFTSSDASATLPANSTLNNGTATFTATLKTAGLQTITATDTTTSTVTGTSASITVSAGAITHYNLAAPATATAGVSANLTLTALDAYNNTATTYTSPINITSSDPALATVPTTPITPTSGVKTISFTLKTAGAQTITFTDVSINTLTATANITVSPAATAKLILNAPPTAVANTAFTVAVTAQDAFSNTTPSYSGTVSFTSSDSSATLPSASTLTNGARTFTNAAKLVTAGSQTITAADTVNSFSNTATIVVGGVTPTITFSIPNYTYGDAPFTVAATSNSSGTLSYSIVSGPATILGNTVTLTGAGTVVVQASQAASGSYIAATQNASFTVAAATPTITFSVPNHTFGDAPFTVAATSNSTGSFTYSIISGPATILGSTVTLTGSGTVVLQASQAATTNYTASTQDATFTVSAEAPTIAFTIPNHTYGDAPFTVSATSNSSGSFTYSIISGPATIVSNTVTLTGTGSVVVQASEVASGSYTSGTQNASFTVSAAAPTITFSIPNHTFGDAPFPVTATSNSTGTFTYSVVSGPATILGNTVTLTGAGSVTLKATEAADPNYLTGSQNATFTVAAASPTITFTIPNHTYGDAPFTVAAISNSSSTFTYSILSGAATILGNTVTLTGTGTVVVQASQIANGNYTSGTQTASFVISAATPTITFTISNHTFGDAPFTVTAASNSTGTFTYSVISGPATILGNTVTLTGPGTVVIQASEAPAGNFTSGTQNATFIVAPSTTPTITFTVPNHTFGDAPFTVTATSNSAGALTYSVVSGPATIVGSTVTLTGAGSVVLKVTQAANGTFSTGSQTATFTVATASPAITFTIPNHTFGDAPFTVTASSNSTGAFTYSVISGPATILGNTVTLTGAGTVTLKANEAADTNYSAGFQTATFTVATASPAITFTIPNHTFGDAPFTVTASSNSTGAFTYSVISGPATILGNTVTLTGAGTVTLKATEAADTNYSAGSQTATFTVATASPAITFTIPNHTFGDAPFTVTAASNSTGTFTYSVISGPATILGNTVTLTGAGPVTLKATEAADPNYSAGSQTAIFTAAKANPSITWPPPASIVYATPLTNTQLDAVATGVAGVTLTGTYTYTPAAGTILPPGPQILTLQFSPSDTADYLTASGTTTITITLATLTISANNATRIYGTPNPTFTGTITGQQNGDTFTESFSSTALPLSTVATYPIIPSASGPNLADYTQNIQDGTLTVTQAGTTGSINITPSTGLAGIPNAFTATITSQTTGTPTGTVQFFANGASIGSAPLVAGQATLNAALTVGTFTITIAYSGDANFLPGTASGASTNFTVVAPDFTFTASPTSVTIPYGGTATFNFGLTPLSGIYYQGVTFSFTGKLPPDAQATFSPATISQNAGPATMVFTIVTTKNIAANHPSRRTTATFLCLLGIPLLLWRRRKSSSRMSNLTMSAVILLLAAVSFTTLTGCGSGFSAADYPLTITAASGGGISHSAAIVLHMAQTPQ